MNKTTYICRLDAIEYIEYTEVRNNEPALTTEPYWNGMSFVKPSGEAWTSIITPSQLILHLSHNTEAFEMHIESIIAGSWGGISPEKAYALNKTRPDYIRVTCGLEGVCMDRTELGLWMIDADIWLTGHGQD